MFLFKKDTSIAEEGAPRSLRRKSKLNQASTLSEALNSEALAKLSSFSTGDIESAKQTLKVKQVEKSAQQQEVAPTWAQQKKLLRASTHISVFAKPEESSLPSWVQQRSSLTTNQLADDLLFKKPIHNQSSDQPVASNQSARHSLRKVSATTTSAIETRSSSAVSWNPSTLRRSRAVTLPSQPSANSEVPEFMRITLKKK
jgi:hypothetical protein